MSFMYFQDLIIFPFWCHFLLTILCFEDNSKNIVLIKIFNLQPRSAKLENFNHETLRETLKINDISFNETLRETLKINGILSNETLDENLKINGILSNETVGETLNGILSNETSRHVETFANTKTLTQPKDRSVREIGLSGVHLIDADVQRTKSTTKKGGNLLLSEFEQKINPANSTPRIVKPLHSGARFPPLAALASDSTPITRKYKRAAFEPSGTVMRFLPRMSGGKNMKTSEECSGLLVKQDFVITASSCLNSFAAFSTVYFDSITYHIRIQIVLYDGSSGYVERSFQRNEVTLLQVKFENNSVPQQHHWLFPWNPIPLGSSIPAQCRVEGYFHTGSPGQESGDPQYHITLLDENSVYKHCPRSKDPQLKSDSLKEFDNVLCRYNVDAENSIDSLCGYLSGAALFCPELQGIFYTTYARSTVPIVKGNILGWPSLGSTDDTMSVLNEILEQSKAEKSNGMKPSSNRMSSFDRYNSSERKIPMTTELVRPKNDGVVGSPNEESRLVKTPRTKTKRSKLTRSASKSSYCGTNKEVALFVSMHFNLDWIRLTIRSNSMFPNAARCDHPMAYWTVISATLGVILFL